MAMTLLQGFFLFTSAFCLLHFVFLPALKKKNVAESQTFSYIRLKVTESVLDLLKTTFLFGAIAFLVLLSFYGVVYLVKGGKTAEALQQSIVSVQHLSSALSTYSTVWSVVVLITLLATLVLFTRAKVRAAYFNIFGNLYAKKFEDLKQLYISGSAPELEPDAQMNQMLEKVALCHRQYHLSDELLRAGEISEQQHLANTEALSKLSGDIRNAYALYDIERRITVTADEVRAARQEIFKNNILGNSLVLSYFEKGGSFLFKAGLVALFISLVSVSSLSLAGDVSKRAIKLNDLLIAKNKEIAEENWRQLNTASKDGEVLFTREDEQLIEHLAAVFENQVLDELVPENDDDDDSDATGSRQALRALSVRHEILKRASVIDAGHGPVRANAHSISRNAAMGELAELPTMQKNLLMVYEEGQVSLTNRSHDIKGRLKLEIMNELRTKPSIWNTLKPKIIEHKVATGYMTETSSLSRKLLSKMVGNGFKISGLDFVSNTTELGTMVDDVIKEIGSTSVETYFETRSKRFLLDVYQKPRIETVINDWQKLPSALSEGGKNSLKNATATFALEQGIVESVSSHPPSINALEFYKTQSLQPVAEKLAQLEGSRIRPSQSAMLESFNSYADYFAPQNGHHTKTTYGKLVSELDSRLGYAATLPTASTGNKSFLRARNFIKLRGFSRIGGVLIGYERAYPNPIDFKNIQWKEASGKLLIDLTRGDGKVFTLGPFKKSIVNHALTYVADGRVVAVTMVTAMPLAELKILMHPAFVDTKFGCRMIEVDRLVDTYLPAEAFIPRYLASRTTQLQNSFFVYAWSYHARQIVDALIKRPDMDEKLKEYLNDILAESDRNLSNMTIRDGAREVLKNPALYFDQENILTTKSEFFDPALVEILKKTISENGQISELDYYLRLSAKNIVQKNNGSSLQRAFVTPPKFQLWSGVREKDFELDNNLKFLEFIPSSIQPEKYPLEFMLQAAFTTPPVVINAFGQLMTGDGYDEKPFDFPSLKTHIASNLFKKVTPEHRSVLADIGEFTILQRMFRTMLNGGFGKEFPIEKLETLAEETIAADQFQKTSRWNVQTDQLEYDLMTEMEVVASMIENRSRKEWINACKKRLLANVSYIKQLGKPSQVPTAAWNQKIALPHGDLISSADNEADEDERILRYIKKRIEETTLTRELRVQLRVNEWDYRKHQYCEEVL